MTEPEIRTEIIVRLKDLTPEQADRIAEALKPIVTKVGGRMSAVDREHHQEYALHLRRRRIV